MGYFYKKDSFNKEKKKEKAHQYKPKKRKKTTLYRQYDKYAESIDNPLGKKEYFDIVKAFNEELFRDMLRGQVVYLPNRLGGLVLTKFKSDRPIVDWRSSVKAGKTKYFLNLDTGGWAVKFHWRRATATFTSRMLWQVKLTLNRKRKDKRTGYYDANIKDYVNQNGLEHFYDIEQIKKSIKIKNKYGTI